MDITNKTIWVTGASSGIGEALAIQLANKGATLILSARRKEKLEALRTRLPRANTHRVVCLDLADYESLATVVQETLAQVGSVDCLINNGGLSQRGFSYETDISVDKRLLDVNYLGTVAMTKALLPSMIKRRQGMIVSVSSVAGKVGSQQRSGYSGSKHAVVGFMDCLRAEVFKFGIKVLVACPGWVQTNISLNALNGKGEPENVMDETIANGITAEACAEEIIKGILLEKDELIIGKGISGFAPLIKRFLPGLVNRIMRNKVYR